ncbi:hypothetical protein CVT24_006808 [Panaeolus cyanescens]|uniref:Uncharacterized protein n=1 Tax=Panaeolus cyanescens TaxID=181874 RepID=A0A409V9B8_9AGAR|nr:hypothetical protein CVT24_006808 [Panaeolus cyanescens]
MKTLSFVLLSLFFVSGQASPLGDREVLRRHNGIALSRRHLLQSRTDAPPACAALAPALPPVSSPTVSGASSSSPATRRHFSGVSLSSDEEFSSSFVESVTTMVSSWESLCLDCGDVSLSDTCLGFGGFDTINALLETADACDQQVIADRMITFAKSDGIRNRDDLIKFAIGYRKHARHAVRIFDVLPSSLYCLRAPINPELVGVYNAQIEGCNPGVFGSSASALVPFGSDGTCPYGMSADVSTCGCSGGDDSSATTTDDGTSSDDTTDSTDSTDDSSDSTDTTNDSSDSTGSTDDSSDSTDSSTDDSSDSSDNTDSSDSSDTSATSTDTSTATDPSDSSSTSVGSATASADNSVATLTDSTSSADASASIVTPTDTSGPNVQPTDISGNVNDPQGR